MHITVQYIAVYNGVVHKVQNIYCTLIFSFNTFRINSHICVASYQEYDENLGVVGLRLEVPYRSHNQKIL